MSWAAGGGTGRQTVVVGGRSRLTLHEVSCLQGLFILSKISLKSHFCHIYMEFTSPLPEKVKEAKLNFI